MRFRPVAAGTLQSILCPRRWSSTCALKSAAGARGGYIVQFVFGITGVMAHYIYRVVSYYVDFVYIINVGKITYFGDDPEGWNIADYKLE